MKLSRKVVVLLILLTLCIIIKWYSLSKDRVEAGYSTGLFPPLAKVLRGTFGQIPFSLGDILYALFAAWLVYKLVRLLIWLLRRPKLQLSSQLKSFGFGFLSFFLLTYIIFNLVWGMNYNRWGIGHQLGMKGNHYTVEDLKGMNCLLITKVNAAKTSLIIHERKYPGTDSMVAKVTEAYNTLSASFPYLTYQQPSLKKTIWNKVGNYSGFSGYYNPFTGEAQFNTSIPKFLQPFTACHEVAHQLGYAKENEANFVGYMAAVASPDTLFHYSVYLELFLYANRNLSIYDSSTARLYRKELIAPVKDDLAEWVSFNKEFTSPLEPAVRWVYGAFLQSNEQPQGILSYDQVTAFIIAYYKKFGKI